jgi:hypothetical protein
MEVIRDEHDVRALTADSSSAQTPVADFRPSFYRELNPVGSIEQVLVEELARRAAEMHEFDKARGVMRATAEQTFVNLVRASDDTSQEALDVARAGATATPQCETLLRQGLAATAAFYRALETLQKLQYNRSGDAWLMLRRPDARFTTERACLAYLARRYVDLKVACRRCGSSGRGSLIAIRACWECGHCRAQTGVRIGTCMARSALPLVVWFGAIRAVLLCPGITPANLAELLGIRRVQTIAGIKKKIQRAIASERASLLLAGLDQVVLGIA